MWNYPLEAEKDKLATTHCFTTRLSQSEKGNEVESCILKPSYLTENNWNKSCKKLKTQIRECNLSQ